MKNLRLLFLMTLIPVLAGMASAAQNDGVSPAADIEEEVAVQNQLVFEDRQSFDLADYNGKVLVVELAAVGCPLSGEVYSALLDLREEYPEGVAFVRIDYGQSIEKNRTYYKKHQPNIDVIGDPTGKIGESFPCQAYPTLFLVGKWGRMRYQGGYDPAALRSMINRLAAEKKVNKKNFFVTKALDKGDALPGFCLPDLAGKSVELNAYRGDAEAFVLVFGGTGCPISRAAVKELKSLSQSKAYGKLAVLVVNIGQKAKDVKRTYEPMNLPFPVLVDAEEKLVKAFGIDTVPTIFIAGKTGEVALRTLWHSAAVTQEVDVLLGKIKAKDKKTFKRQGSG